MARLQSACWALFGILAIAGGASAAGAESAPQAPALALDIAPAIVKPWEHRSLRFTVRIVAAPPEGIESVILDMPSSFPAGIDLPDNTIAGLSSSMPVLTSQLVRITDEPSCPVVLHLRPLHTEQARWWRATLTCRDGTLATGDSVTLELPYWRLSIPPAGTYPVAVWPAGAPTARSTAEVRVLQEGKPSRFDGQGQAAVRTDGDVYASEPAYLAFEYTAGESGIAESGAIFLGWPHPYSHARPPATRPPDWKRLVQSGAIRVHSESAPDMFLLDVIERGFHTYPRITRRSGPILPGETIRVTIGRPGSDSDFIAPPWPGAWPWAVFVDGDGDGTPAPIAEPPVVTLHDTPAWRERETVFQHPGRPLTPQNLPEAVRGYRVLWGDLHGHTAESDGLGTVEQYFRFARATARLDFAAVTDHVHHLTPDGWRRTRAAVRTHHAPGAFVSILGYEYASARGYHRIDYAVSDEMTPPFPTQPTQYALVDLTGRRQQFPLLWTDPSTPPRPPVAWSAAHTTANYAPVWDTTGPVRDPVVEIYSAHGSSESCTDDTPRRIWNCRQSGSVHAALTRGYRFGFIAAGDSHDGRPGLTRWGEFSGGLTGIYAAALTRKDITEAIRERRTFATTGPRIHVMFSTGGDIMGAVLERDAAPTFDIAVSGTAPVAVLEIIKGGAVAYTQSPATQDVRVSWTDDAFGGDTTRHWYYARITQDDGHLAWSSPIWVTSVCDATSRCGPGGAAPQDSWWDSIRRYIQDF